MVLENFKRTTAYHTGYLFPVKISEDHLRIAQPDKLLMVQKCMTLKPYMEFHFLHWYLKQCFDLNIAKYPNDLPF